MPFAIQTAAKIPVIVDSETRLKTRKRSDVRKYARSSPRLLFYNAALKRIKKNRKKKPEKKTAKSSP